MGCTQTRNSDISGMTRNEVAKDIFRLLDDDNSKGLDVTELRGQGFSAMVDQYFANDAQHMTEDQFVAALLNSWSNDGKRAYQKKAIAIIDLAKTTFIGTSEQEARLKECKSKEEMAKMVFEALDDDKSGHICYTELVKQLDPHGRMLRFQTHICPETKKKVVRSNSYWGNTFKAYDKDESGSICLKEFTASMMDKYKHSDDLYLLTLACMLKKADLMHVTDQQKKGKQEDVKEG